jgi:hypothetical protein
MKTTYLSNGAGSSAKYPAAVSVENPGTDRALSGPLQGNGACESGKYFCPAHRLPLCLVMGFPYTQPSPLEGSGMDASILLNLDVFTLMLMALGGYSLGFITLSIIWSTHREIPGPGSGGGPASVPWRRNRSSSCRHFSPYRGIWLANLLITFCLALMPLAIQRFFGEPPNWRAFTSSCWSTC